MLRGESDRFSIRRMLSNTTEFDEPGDRFMPTRSLMNLDLAQRNLPTLRGESDRFSPRRMPSNTTEFVDPGDRFIPTRSLMNLDLARCSLRRRPDSSITSPSSSVISTIKEEYKKIVEENLTLDAEGKPIKMLVFKGSPRICRRQLRLIDEMLKEGQDGCKAIKTFRHLPKSPDRVLDAPNLVDDYYLNLMDWGQNNILAVALGSKLYLWNAGSGDIKQLMHTEDEEDYLTSVAWSHDAKMVAVGLTNSKIQIWDATTTRQVRRLEGHSGRVGSLAWNDHILTSGSHDKLIINHDVRASASSVSRLRAHSEEVCGLRWSGDGTILASGGNDNLLYIWEAPNRVSSKYLHRLEGHQAAVKALAWCPFQSNILASGGGTADRCIKMWNTQTGQCMNSFDTKAQVCALEWNRHQKEILSAHGFSQNQLCLWRYPSMSKLGELTGHTARILHLSQSPDGLTVVSASADETLRFWKVFGPPQSASSKTEDKESTSPLSINRLHIR